VCEGQGLCRPRVLPADGFPYVPVVCMEGAGCARSSPFARLGDGRPRGRTYLGPVAVSIVRLRGTRDGGRQIYE